MEFLISLYDNALIYYPNVFFAMLFFIGILGIILVSIGIIALWKEVRRVIKEMKSSLKQVKRIKKEERKRTPFVQIINVFFARNRIFFLQAVRVIFIKINAILVRAESQIEKIIKKIGEEILIRE